MRWGIFVGVFLMGIFLGPTVSLAARPATFGLKEGDVIRATGDFDIYIVNDFGIKRLFINPKIFGLYGHLGFSKVKEVAPSVRDALPTSGYFKNCESGDGKVYALEKLSEDSGRLHHVNLTKSAADSQDKFFFNKVFCINNQEFLLYGQGSAINSISQAPSYSRADSPFIRIRTPSEYEYWREGQIHELTWHSSGVSKINISAAIGGHDRGVIATVEAGRSYDHLGLYEIYEWQIPYGFVSDLGLDYSDAVTFYIHDAYRSDVYDKSSPPIIIAKSLGGNIWSWYIDTVNNFEFEFPVGEIAEAPLYLFDFPLEKNNYNYRTLLFSRLKSGCIPAIFIGGRDMPNLIDEINRTSSGAYMDSVRRVSDSYYDYIFAIKRESGQFSESSCESILNRMANSFRSSGLVDARDAKRVLDINQLQLALELYKNQAGLYPRQLNELVGGGYINQIPTDPKSGLAYFYAVSGIRTDYHLGAALEGPRNRALCSDADVSSVYYGYQGGFDGGVRDISNAYCNTETSGDMSFTGEQSPIYDVKS